MALADLPEVLTVEEAASVLRISRTAAYGQAHRWLATNGREGLPVVRIGRSLRVPRAGLEHLLGAAAGDTVGAGHQCRGVRAAAAVAVQLVITAPSRRVRAELGPLAWAALETVALDAEPDGDGVFRAATTVRKLAGQLEVNKDTAGRAPRPLDRARLPVPDRAPCVALHAHRRAANCSASPSASDEPARPLCSTTPGASRSTRPVKADTSASTVTRPTLRTAAGDRSQRSRHRPRQQRAANTEQLTLIELSPERLNASNAMTSFHHPEPADMTSTGTCHLCEVALPAALPVTGGRVGRC